MNIARRVAQFVLELNKIQSEALIRLYGRLNFYKKLYAACGLPDEIAARLEQKMLDAMYRGVEEQHLLASRWLRGESDLPDFLDRYGDWFREHLDRCSRITVEELCSAP
jgi:hypothetical protein